MLLTIISSIICAVLAGLGVYLIYRKQSAKAATILLNQAKQKAKAIELEANNLLKTEQLKLKEQEFELHKEYKSKLCELEAKEQRLNEKIKQDLNNLNEKSTKLNQELNQILLQKAQNEKLQNKYNELIKILNDNLSNYCGFSKNEAKDLLLKNLEHELENEKANIIRRHEKEAHEQARKKANFILALATSRFAGEFAAERLVNLVSIPDEETKGKIIGKDGRNIKAFERVSGVDVIIDDTPLAISVSSHDLYNRAIASKTLELLIEDGRINPARIEEVHARVKEQIDEDIEENGRNAILDLGIEPTHPEITKLIGRLLYRASYGQNALQHSLQTAQLAGSIAAQLGGDEKLARRAGLLHDIGKALTTREGNSDHVKLGADICKRYKEHPVVINAILSHHGNEEFKSIEAAAVCAADSLSAARPGARRDVLENFLQRMQNLEAIAMDKLGVKQAYAISAGRELRVIVEADLISDAQSIILAKEIADEIRVNLQFPGEIKVNVIRETRAVEFCASQAKNDF